MNGRYRTLLKWIDVPLDAHTYGEVQDWGWYSGTSYAGHDQLPVGYWVYVHPRWYIWKERVAPRGPEATQAEISTASLGGKYGGFKRALYVPEDARTWGEQYDYGYSTEREYREFTGLVPGYWVYQSPRWYLFLKLLKKDAAPGVPSRMKETGKDKPVLRPPSAEPQLKLVTEQPEEAAPAP